MEKYFRYTFEVKSDSGKFFLTVISYKRSNAREMICKSENCPKNAVKFVSATRVFI